VQLMRLYSWVCSETVTLMAGVMVVAVLTLCPVEGRALAGLTALGLSGCAFLQDRRKL
jgi:hypothetical protein